jgi:hypothetical protein
MRLEWHAVISGLASETAGYGQFYQVKDVEITSARGN